MQITQIQDPTLMWGENQSVQQIRNFLFSSKQFLKLEKFSGREGDPAPLGLFCRSVLDLSAETSGDWVPFPT